MIMQYMCSGYHQEGDHGMYYASNRPFLFWVYFGFIFNIQE